MRLPPPQALIARYVVTWCREIVMVRDQAVFFAYLYALL